VENATTFEVRGEVWLYPGDAGWHFVTLPPDVADEIRARPAGTARAFGSVPVRATLGATSWTTSLFADRKSSSYLLPLNAATRRRERIGPGDAVAVAIELR
jgi:Domain of unknown function (DUF1905)